MDATTPRDIFQVKSLFSSKSALVLDAKKVVREKETQKRDWKKNDR